MHGSERRKWLEGLQVGDEVSNGEQILTIERVTATQITASGRRYMRSSGNEHGSSPFTDGWRLVPADYDERERVARMQRIERARAKLRRIHEQTRPFVSFYFYGVTGAWSWNDEQTIAIDAAADALIVALNDSDGKVRS